MFSFSSDCSSFDSSFYSKWESEPVREVNWKELPVTRTLEWYEVTKTRNAVSDVLITLSIASAAAVFFTAALIVHAAAVVSAVAFFVTGVYLRMQEDHPLDPDFRMEERNDIKDAPQIPHVGTLNSLVNRFIITKSEKQALLHQNIYHTDYDIFTEKHGEIIFDELDSENLSLLKLKFLDYLSNCEITDTDLTDILDSKANDYFNLMRDDLAFLIQEDDLAEDDQEESEQEKTSESTLNQLASQFSSYAAPTLKFAAAMAPSSVKAAGELAIASAQLARQGKIKQSTILALNAATCIAIQSTKSVMKILYPEASEIAKQQMMYEKYFIDS